MLPRRAPELRSPSRKEERRAWNVWVEADALNSSLFHLLIMQQDWVDVE